MIQKYIVSALFISSASIAIAPLQASHHHDPLGEHGHGELLPHNTEDAMIGIMQSAATNNFAHARDEFMPSYDMLMQEHQLEPGFNALVKIYKAYPDNAQRRTALKTALRTQNVNIHVYPNPNPALSGDEIHALQNLFRHLGHLSNAVIDRAWP
tara:strand:- start:52 stop:513 length:462 start_codon:yes stop_codon:yes gene_type:complete